MTTSPLSSASRRWSQTRRQLLLLTASMLPVMLALMLWVDKPLALLLHQGLPELRGFFSALTTASDQAYSTVFQLHKFPLGLGLLLLGFGVGWFGLKRPGSMVLLVTFLTHIVSKQAAYVLKGVVQRPRPEVFFQHSTVHEYFWVRQLHADSFPSSHTAVYLSLLLPLAFRFPRFAVLALAWPTLIAVGRLELGMHYLSDVLFSVYLVSFFTLLFGLLYAVPAPGKQLPGAGVV